MEEFCNIYTWKKSGKICGKVRQTDRLTNWQTDSLSDRYFSQFFSIFLRFSFFPYFQSIILFFPLSAFPNFSIPSFFSPVGFSPRAKISGHAVCYIHGFQKNCVLSQLTASPPLPAYRCNRSSKFSRISALRRSPPDGFSVKSGWNRFSSLSSWETMQK